MRAPVLTRDAARAALARCGIANRPAFEALDMAAVFAVLTEADRMNYRKPSESPWPRVRCFYAYLQRRATGSAKG